MYCRALAQKREEREHKKGSKTQNLEDAMRRKAGLI